MTRFASGAAWFIGAAVLLLGYWAAVVYALDQWDRGYGRDTWFFLQLYLSGIAVVVGLISYVIAGFVRPRPAGFAATLAAGVVFGVCHLLLAFVLRRVFPDREILVQQFVGAIVLGAASALVARFASP